MLEQPGRFGNDPYRLHEVQPHDLVQRLIEPRPIRKELLQRTPAEFASYDRSKAQYFTGIGIEPVDARPNNSLHGGREIYGLHGPRQDGLAITQFDRPFFEQ